MRAYPIQVIALSTSVLPKDMDVSDGCEVARHCLECPLPRCHFDVAVQRGGRSGDLAARDREIFSAREQGMSVDEVAERFGVSRRTVMRATNWAKAQR